MRIIREVETPLSSGKLDGYLDDYAFLTQGLLDLYEASFDTCSGMRSRAVISQPAARIGPSCCARKAYPSLNSVAAMNLLRLWQITDQQSYKDKANKTLATFGPSIEQRPEAMPYMMSALDFSLAKARQIVIAGVPDAPDTHALLRLVWQRYIPNRVLLLADGAEGAKAIGTLGALSGDCDTEAGTRDRLHL